jgi:5-hydroxyisourate hydrolase
MSGISTHVLDLTQGRPAEGLKVRLDRLSGTGWEALAERVTDADGRVADLLVAPQLVKGIHRLSFETRDYAHGRGVPTFYPEVQVMFEIGDPAKHYHVPLLFSPYGYSTYRGS